jgi:NADH-quinone oxidoreductase subunit I
VDAEYERETFVYGKDKLVEKIDKRIDVTKRQTLEVAEFKKLPGTKHNTLYDGKAINKGKH